MSDPPDDGLIDLRTCPNCGAEDFPIVSVERVYGYLPIDLTLQEGEWLAAFESMTDMDWGTSVSAYYACRECYEELPERYATVLDRFLSNTRDQHEEERES